VKTDKGGFEFCVSHKLPHLWALLRGQWRITRFMAQRDLPDHKIAESLALGLCLQSLMLQLGSSTHMLAPWLAKPDSAPPQYRRVIHQLQAVQMRRTGLSSAWNELFPTVHQAEAAAEDLPAFFWDVPPSVTAAPKPIAPAGPDFTGTPASGGQVVGRAVTDMKNIPNDGSPLILIFRQARPETVELFGHAAGLIFAEGGVLSHACTVARERNIPAVTGVGTGFLDYLKPRAGAWVSIDGDTGMVRVVESGER
jgi:phosphohistidine swiveling domain-containing protein